MAKKTTIKKYDDEIGNLQEKIKLVQQERQNYIGKRYQEIGKLYCQIHYGNQALEMFDEIVSDLKNTKSEAKNSNIVNHSTDSQE